jgi:serine protease AprX
VAAVLVASAGEPTTVPAPSAAENVAVIVQELPGTGSGPERAVTALGGTVDSRLGIIDAFTARVPVDRLSVLRTTPGVRAVTENASVALASTDVADQAAQTGSLDSITELVGATAMWAKGYTGQGVDVAVLDSGVVPVDGLRTPGKVVYGPDLSFHAQQCTQRGRVKCANSPAYNLDAYGHGTAMAGIIAGRDDAAPAIPSATAGDTDYLGMAPDARIVSVKVADGAGAADVSQVIAGIDWVVQNRKKNGLNIRVLNLSFGTDGVQNYLLDPLTYAAEVAWRSGIVVVASAGNRGSADGKLVNPAYDPYVLAVGAVDDQGTKGTGDDVIPSWSSKGDGIRNPDLVAPGAGVVSLRDPLSALDYHHPAARVGSRFFRGSGTSQAAAVVSGAVALLLSQRPNMSADQVKALLMGTARNIPSADVMGQGRGLVNLANAMTTTPLSPGQAAQRWARSTGLGSLDAARGSAHVLVRGGELKGETTASGATWVAPLWTASAASGATWSGGSWSSGVWSGGSWNGAAWFGNPFNGDHFAGETWNGSEWTSAPWVPDADGEYTATTGTGALWTASTWAASTWAASTWAASTWAASTWAASTWAASTWG